MPIKQLTLCSILAMVLIACANFDENGADLSPHHSEQQPVKPAQPPMPGGITPVDKDNADAMLAGRFAAKQLGSQLDSITSAAKQVVAGMNYHLTIKLTNRSIYRVVVYRNLQNQFQLTSSNRITPE